MSDDQVGKLGYWITMAKIREVQLNEANAEIERLREALQFIADNWRNANVDMDAFYWKARAALGEGKE